MTEDAVPGLPAQRPDTVTLNVEGARYTFRAPPAWHDRVQALAEYIPRNNTVYAALRSMSDHVRDGFVETAHGRLQWAEDSIGNIKATG